MDEPVSDPNLIARYPSFCMPNIWPDHDLPKLAPAFLNLGRLIVGVGLLVAKQCDRFVRDNCDSYDPSTRMHDIIRDCKTPKGRLLHYFPHEAVDVAAANDGKVADDRTSGKTEPEFSSWCGWHNDHGSLTGLVPATYFDCDGNEVKNPDPECAGLFIRARDGLVHKVVVPKDHLAFQIGETAQIHSGGLLRATPHCVRGPRPGLGKGVARDTFAVFMEPFFDEKMNPPAVYQRDELFRGSEFFPPGVPRIQTRWNEEMDFGQFTDATLKSYYS